MQLVVVDAGHGGRDSGAVGMYGVLEKDLNLKYAMALCESLHKFGVYAVPTRRDDRFIALEDRADVANVLDADLFVSIHCNAFHDEQANGFEIWTSKHDIDEPSCDLANMICNDVGPNIPNLRMRGVKHGRLVVLDKTIGHSILIECGFITNEDDYDVLCDDYIYKELIKSIRREIVLWLEDRKQNN